MQGCILAWPFLFPGKKNEREIIMPDEPTIEQDEGQGGSSASIVPAPPEQSYTIANAVDDSFKEEKKEPVKEPTPKEGKTTEKPPQQSPLVQPSPKTPELDEETRKAVEFYRLATTDPKYQEMLYQELSNRYQKPQETSPTPQKSPEEVELDEILGALDPGVKRALEGISDRKIAALQKEVNDWKKIQTEKEQVAQQVQVKREFEEFSSTHKEELKKYEKSMLELSQRYPDLLRGGKHGLETLLKLVSEDDRIAQRVAEEVEKALTHSKNVSEKVKRFSVGTNTPATSHSAKGGNYSLEDAYEDAIKSKSISV